MSLESTIYTRLTNDAGVTALVSTRIYPISTGNIVPTGGQAYIAYSRAPGNPNPSFDGIEWEDAALEFDCYAFGATAPEQAEAIASAVRKSLEGYRATGIGPGAYDSEFDGDPGEEDVAVRTVVVVFPLDRSILLA